MRSTPNPRDRAGYAAITTPVAWARTSAAIALGVLASFACTSTRVRSEEAATAVATDQPVVRGTVTFRERLALPPNARVVVRLSDVSRMDVAATTIAETTFVVGTRQVPIVFMLPYDRARIDPSHRYAVGATILTGGQLMFSTDSAYHVITMGSPTQVELRLVRASGGTVPSPPTALQGTSWRLEEIDGRPVLDQVEATLEFLDSARVAGSASCNRFFGSVQISGDSIAFGQMGATQMACEDEVSRQETAYLQALETAERFERDDTTLTIYSRGMERPLRFRRRDRR